MGLACTVVGWYIGRRWPPRPAPEVSFALASLASCWCSVTDIPRNRIPNQLGPRVVAAGGFRRLLSRLWRLLQRPVREPPQQARDVEAQPVGEGEGEGEGRGEDERRNGIELAVIQR